MRLLVLGGTVFLGRHVAEEAVRRDHEVTLFHRGRHGIDVLAGAAEHVLGDRGGDVGALAGRTWDATVDCSGFAPADVARSAALDTGHYVYVSSISAYMGWPDAQVDEDAPTWTEGEDYGALKAACERATPARSAIVRAGLLCGPYDNVGRLSWWIERVAAGGGVVAPGPAERELQLIDARDLAAWMVDLAERGQAGTFNGTAPRGQTTMRAMLEAAIRATGSNAELRWFDGATLSDAGVEPWDELPLWHPGRGTWTVGTERAQAAGLRCRSVAETVADTWAWLRSGAAPSDYRAELRPGGLSREHEETLLAGA